MKVGVIGSGTMGRGIALAYANAGHAVAVVDVEAAALERFDAEVGRTYAGAVARNRMTTEEAAVNRARITAATDLDALRGAAVVTEAVFEDMKVKQDLLRRLEPVLAADALIASNTSTLDIDAMAATLRAPGRFLGMHFFSPANVMKLLEIVRGATTASDTVERAVVVARQLGKTPVVVGNCFGFVGNRMLFARAAECERLLLEGSTPRDNDAALTEFGFPMGQHAMMDLSGLDVEWRIRQPRNEVRPVSDALYAQKRWGQKSGAGFYLYEPGNRTPVPDGAVDALCRTLGAQLGHPVRSFTREELLQRQLFPLVAEGARLLEDGIAANAVDIDTIWRAGYGWPAERGGPMRWADKVGAGTICAVLDRMATERDDDALRPPALLRRMAESGGTFHPV